LDLSRGYSTPEAESDLFSSGLPETQALLGYSRRSVGVDLDLARLVFSELRERVEQDLDAFSLLDASDKEQA
jgi:hypothetical protein